MAFVPPTFPLHCYLWRGNGFQTSWASGGGFVPDPDDEFLCQLRAQPHFAPGLEFGASGCTYELLVPNGSDIRPPVYSTAEWWYWMPVIQIVEQPDQYYFVFAVQDVAAGFSNVYRRVTVLPSWCTDGAQLSGWPHWPWLPPWPVPLPAWPVP